MVAGAKLTYIKLNTPTAPAFAEPTAGKCPPRAACQSAIARCGGGSSVNPETPAAAFIRDEPEGTEAGVRLPTLCREDSVLMVGT